MNETRTLARFVADTTFTDLPRRLVENLKITGLETVRGFHNPGTQGPFGAAVAVGKLYGFDEARLTDALGIAGSSSAGLLEFAWSGGDTKRLHLGRAAQLGLESALPARQGVRGPA